MTPGRGSGPDSGPGRRPPARAGKSGSTGERPGGRRCANPLCGCLTVEFTCSLWCGPLDVRRGSRCLCRHDACVPAGLGAAARGLGEADLYPPVLDRFRLDRRLAAGGRT